MSKLATPIIDKYHSVLIAHQDDPTMQTIVTVTRGASGDRVACYAQVTQFPYRHDDEGLLTTLDVRPGLQGRGYGAQLLQVVCEVIDSLHWEVWLAAAGDIGGDRDRLVRFYEKFGWVSHPEDRYTMNRPRRDRPVRTSLD